VTKRAMGGRR